MKEKRAWLRSFRRDGNSGVLIQIAREVVERRRSVQAALSEVRHPAVLDALADEDFHYLDAVVAEYGDEYPEFSTVLARLTHVAARAKGFDRQIVDAALRLDALLPADDLSQERDRLLRDAYTVAQRAGYVTGGRTALARLGRRAYEGDDLNRAQVLLQQQLEIGPESEDTIAEVESALTLADLLRREGNPDAAQTYYRRAGRSAQRINHHHGSAEALIRQIELLRPDTGLETLAALQRQALDAAKRTMDEGLQSRIVLALAETLLHNGQRDEAIPHLEAAITLAQEIGDLSLEGRCLATLIEAERQTGRLQAAAGHEAALLHLEERLGNRPAAAEWAAQLGATYLSLGEAEPAAETFRRALTLAVAIGDSRLEQRALGGLGLASTALNRPDDALDHLMQALNLARRGEDLAHQAQWLGGIGQVLWKFNQPDAAIDAIEEAIAIARRVDDTELQATMLALLGQIYAAGRQTPRARECYSRALDLNRRLGQTGAQVPLLAALAELALETRQVGQASSLYEQGLRLATATGDRLAAIRIHARLGRLAQRQRNPIAALDHLERARDLAEAAGQPALLSQALQHLATVQHASGDSAAVETYRQALALCADLRDTQGEALMLLNLGALLSGNGHRDEGLTMLYRVAALAPTLGPRGEELAQRAEEAIAAAGGAAKPADNGSTDAALPDLSFPSRAISFRATEEEDAVFQEATLPPR